MQKRQDAFLDRRFCSDIFLYIQQQQLLGSAQRVLLAVSGGLDSMVLLHFFERFAEKKYAVGFVVAHLDHALRSESGDDAEWLSSYCQERGLKFVSDRLEISEIHADSKLSSLEAVARKERYDWLLTQAERFDCAVILTAHNASDQLETMLMHWVRGGVSGLQGMPVSRQLKSGGPYLSRPLLACSRKDLEAYVAHHQLSWREDLSNQSRDFFRNRLRHDLIPWFLAENPTLEKSVTELSEIWRDEQLYLEQEALRLLTQEVHRTESRWFVSTVFFLTIPRALQRRLVREILTVMLGQWKVFGHRHIESVRHLASGPGGKVLALPEKIVVKKEKKQLYFYRLASDAEHAD